MTVESFGAGAREMRSLPWNEPVAAAKALVGSFFRIEVSTGDHDHVHSARWTNLAWLLGRHVCSKKESVAVETDAVGPVCDLEHVRCRLAPDPSRRCKSH
jgi:hypothetical protein